MAIMANHDIRSNGSNDGRVPLEQSQNQEIQSHKKAIEQTGGCQTEFNNYKNQLENSQNNIYNEV